MPIATSSVEVLRRPVESALTATKNNLHTVAAAARTIAAICDAKESGAIPLLAGDNDVLPALHGALGKGIEAGHGLHEAQFGAFQLAKRLGLLLTDNLVPTCECASAWFRENAGKVLVGNGAVPVA